MTPDAFAYYRALSDGYEEKIRQLVPKYDELTGVAIDHVVRRQPETVLDIGCGTGALTEKILERLAGAIVTAVDASPEMIGRARARLARFGRRACVVEGDIASCEFERPFALLFSSLVLHNLDPAAKTRVLRSMVRALEPHGAFVWADLIRHPDPNSQAEAVAYRRRFAVEAGCDPELVAVNFQKEASVDTPLTVAGMVQVAAETGLAVSQVLWTHDTFAVLAFERGPA